MSYDVLISHASEDTDIARGLKNILKNEYKVEVWFDEDALKAGDSLCTQIQRGLVQSRFVVVILSRALFQKDWAKRELNNLVSLELSRKGLILPVWHDIDRDFLIRKGQTFLLDGCAADTRAGLPNVAFRLAKVICPERVPVAPDKATSHKARFRRVFFIAYASKDRPAAKKLYTALEKARARPFLDRYDIPIGEIWGKALVKGQEESRVTVVLMSSNSYDASGLNEEIARGLRLSNSGDGHNVVAVYLADPNGLRIPYGLESRQNIIAFGDADIGTAAEELLTRFPPSDPSVLDPYPDFTRPSLAKRILSLILGRKRLAVAVCVAILILTKLWLKCIVPVSVRQLVGPKNWAGLFPDGSSDYYDYQFTDRDRWYFWNAGPPINEHFVLIQPGGVAMPLPDSAGRRVDGAWWDAEVHYQVKLLPGAKQAWFVLHVTPAWPPAAQEGASAPKFGGYLIWFDSAGAESRLWAFSCKQIDISSPAPPRKESGCTEVGHSEKFLASTSDGSMLKFYARFRNNQAVVKIGFPAQGCESEELRFLNCSCAYGNFAVVNFAGNEPPVRVHAFAVKVQPNALFASKDFLGLYPEHTSSSEYTRSCH